MKHKSIPFGDLSPEHKKAILDAIPIGTVEVSCPWWSKNHWEPKLKGELFDEAFYRIISKNDTISSN